MHLSTHNWMRAEPLDTTLKRIKKFGYESIEISGEPDAVRDQGNARASEGARHPLLGRGDADARRAQPRRQGPGPARALGRVRQETCITMVSELDGEIITLVPATVGKVVPDGTEEEEWKWVVDATTRMLRPRQEGRRAGSPSSRSTASRPISSTAPRRRWRWPTRSAPNAASASTPSTSTSRRRTCMTRSGKAGKRLFDFHVADNNRFAAGLGHARLEEDRRHAEGDRLRRRAHQRVRRAGRPHAGQPLSRTWSSATRSTSRPSS